MVVSVRHLLHDINLPITCITVGQWSGHGENTDEAAPWKRINERHVSVPCMSAAVTRTKRCACSCRTFRTLSCESELEPNIPGHLGGAAPVLCSERVEEEEEEQL